ncbi:MAG: hypothetical protein ABWX68_12865 [Arthrobacter sp.]|uniref:hypothetical protein n=1 Tax=Arthrobacter sp. TaxID=1667 RepID=UPI00347BE576
MPASKARGHRAATRAPETAPTPVTAGAPDPWCPGCRTADHLVFEAAMPRIDATGLQDTAWDVEYWCARCDCYYGHETAHLPKAAAPLAAGVVYIHCGQAMSPAAIEPLVIGARGHVTRRSLPAVVMDTQLWRCQCGFALAVPDPGDA